MEYRRLGNSGLNVPVLSFGTATFGGGNEFFKAWGSTDVAEAKRLIDVCMDAGLNFFDTANTYSGGRAEEILSKAIEGRRHEMIISTKATFPVVEKPGPNDMGSSRGHILREVEASLRRLGTDYIDLYHMHGADNNTPIEETLSTLDTLVKSGKVRYIACSNFSGWQLMKSLSISEREGYAKYVGHQVYYSLLGRELEWELMPLAEDQGVSHMIWSPLAGGALSGKISRTKTAPKDSRLGQVKFVPYEDEHLYRVVDELEKIAHERDKSIPQVALNWVLRRPTVANVVVGARNEQQLKQNLGALGWKLTAEEVARLDAASATPVLYPYWHQRGFPTLQRPFNPTAQ